MTGKRVLAELNEAGVEFKERFLLKDLTLTLVQGEQVAIVGDSGSGKTLLGKLLCGQLDPNHGTAKIFPGVSKTIFVSQQHIHNLSISSRSYYQQRYDSNYGDSSPLVSEHLKNLYPDREADIYSLLHTFKLEYILSRRLIQLSNGEGKRLQLILALLEKPEVLILDSPFTGVDKENRKEIFNLLDHFKEQKITYVLITQPDLIPKSVNKIILMEVGKIKEVHKPSDFHPASLSNPNKEINHHLLNHLYYSNPEEFSIAIKMDRVSIQYGEQTILSDINWEVKKGERWLIRGGNGSGKSMLLSLINGDNPKAFGKEIFLFDQKKGSGESIWDLKKKIGYVSPELHFHFLRRPEHIAELVGRTEKYLLEDPYQPKTACKEVVASGFHDQIGFTDSNTSFQEAVVETWMKFLGLEALSDQPFYQISLGQQRLLLLARAFVKNPPLLILDEPCQGLDDHQTSVFKNTVDALCRKFNKTLLFVTHYDKDIPDCIDHILELKDGHIIRKDSFCFSS